MAKTKREREKEEERQEKTRQESLSKIRLIVEKQFKDEYRDFDRIDVKDLWAENYRWLAWRNNQIIDSKFVKLTADGIITVG